MPAMPATPIDDDVLFHVGFHKTGTTWLQNRVFVPDNGFLPVLGHREVRHLITGPNRLVFDPSAVRAHLDRTAGADSVERQRVVSSELLCGNPFSGNRECADFAERIREIGVGTKILVTVRNQVGMIAATYAQYVRRGGTRTVAQFLDPPPVGFEGFEPDAFLYDRVVDLYRRLFGDAQVCVIPHEAMRTEPLAELNRLRSFCDLPPWTELPRAVTSQVNTSSPERTLDLQRRINRIRASASTPNPIIDLGRVARGLSKACEKAGVRLEPYRRGPGCPVSQEVSERLSDRYLASNRRLQQMLGDQFDLAELGYRM